MIVHSQITAIALLSIGLSILRGVYYEYHDFLADGFFFVSSLLIAVGSIIFIIALLGCCGAGRESYCMIVTVRQTFVKSILIVCSFCLKYICLDAPFCGKCTLREEISKKIEEYLFDGY